MENSTMVTVTEPFAHTSGPRNAKVVFVGEAWGEDEETYKVPFVGSSGMEFWRILGEAWAGVDPQSHTLARSAMPRYKDSFGKWPPGSLSRWISLREIWMEKAQVLFTNVFALRPPNSNNVENLCVKKEESGEGGRYLPLAKGKYLQARYLGEVDRLYHELDEIRPNLIVALGNTACWATAGATNIGTIRGAVAGSRWLDRPRSHGAGEAGFSKVLPTYHPASVLYNWSWRPIVVIDLMKALREAEFPEVRRPRREIIVNPDLVEIRRWYRDDFLKARIVSVDIETKGKQITCIGFATTRDRALVIPFWDSKQPDGNYWPTLQYELEVWGVVRSVLESPVPKLFQNGMYDLQYLAKMGFKVRNCQQDTMLLHHSLFPEMQKGLGFMGSIYTNEAAWKLMRLKKPDSEKRDE